MSASRVNEIAAGASVVPETSAAKPRPAGSGRNGRVRLIATLVVFGLISIACTTTTEADFSSNPESLDASDASDGAAAGTDPDCDENDPTPSLRPSGELSTLSSSEPGTYMAEIRDRGTLRAGIGVDTPLFGFIDPLTGEVGGFDVEMARLVAAALFGDPNRVDFVPVQSAEREARIQDGTVDLVVKTMTINCPRWGNINFSTVYYLSGQRLLVSVESPLTGIDDVTDERVCTVGPSTTSIAELQARNIQNIVEVDGWTQCLIAFQQGDAEAISTDDTILAGLASQDPFAKIVGANFTSEPYGIGLPKEHPEFTEFVNAVLEEARTDGTWTELYEKWLEEPLGANPRIPSASYR